MVIEVTDDRFERDVIRRSHELPVVVDFWAAWCGPCRVLGPMLEHAVQARSPNMVLAKVDVDSNPAVAQRYGIRGIPAVKAFRNGEVVAEFVGAQPAATVERFLDGLVPSQADALLSEGDEQSLRDALALEPGRPDAVSALARLLLERGELEAALELLEPIEGDFLAEGLAARARLALSRAGERYPGIGEALDQLSEGNVEDALEALAAAIEITDEETRELIRKLMVGLFTELGADHPLSTTYRRKLAAALY
jgi:putative thioredoxin